MAAHGCSSPFCIAHRGKTTKPVKRRPRRGDSTAPFHARAPRPTLRERRRPVQPPRGAHAKPTLIVPTRTAGHRGRPHPYRASRVDSRDEGKDEAVEGRKQKRAIPAKQADGEAQSPAKPTPSVQPSCSADGVSVSGTISQAAWSGSGEATTTSSGTAPGQAYEGEMAPPHKHDLLSCCGLVACFGCDSASCGGATVRHDGACLGAVRAPAMPPRRTPPRPNRGVPDRDVPGRTSSQSLAPASWHSMLRAIHARASMDTRTPCNQPPDSRVDTQACPSTFFDADSSLDGVTSAAPIDSGVAGLYAAASLTAELGPALSRMAAAVQSCGSKCGTSHDGVIGCADSGSGCADSGSGCADSGSESGRSNKDGDESMRADVVSPTVFAGHVASRGAFPSYSAGTLCTDNSFQSRYALLHACLGWVVSLWFLCHSFTRANQIVYGGPARAECSPANRASGCCGERSFSSANLDDSYSSIMPMRVSEGRDSRPVGIGTSTRQVFAGESSGYGDVAARAAGVADCLTRINTVLYTSPAQLSASQGTAIATSADVDGGSPALSSIGLLVYGNGGHRSHPASPSAAANRDMEATLGHVDVAALSSLEVAVRKRVRVMPASLQGGGSQLRCCSTARRVAFTRATCSNSMIHNAARA